MNLGDQIQRVGTNWWSNAYENVNQNILLYIHSRDHLVYVGRVWPGRGYMTAEQWLAFRPKVKALAEDMIALGHPLPAILWENLNAFEEDLNIVFTNAELDMVQGRLGERPVRKHCYAL